MKGLEAPVVILTSVAFFGGHTAETRIEHTGSDPSGYLFTLSRGNKKGFYFSTGMVVPYGGRRSRSAGRRR